MFRVDRKISVKLTVILLVLVLFGVMYAQSAKPAPAQSQAPVPLLAHYPRVSPEFLAQYPDEPVEKVVQANTAELYRAAILQQTGRIDALEKRIAELERLVAPKPADPTPASAPAVENKDK